MKIVIADKARVDLRGIHAYIAARNPTAADHLIVAIDDKLTQLSRFPFIGRDRSRLGQGIRSIVVGNYVIFHLVEDDRIIVVRIVDGRRDIDEEFKR